MVSVKSLAAASLAGLLPLASAGPMISKLTAPATATAGDNITVTLGTSIYIQNWEDFNIAWGLAPKQFGGQGSNGEIYIGTQIGYTTLYGTGLSKLPNFTVDVTIPENQPEGEWKLVAAVPYLVGVSSFFLPFLASNTYCIRPVPVLIHKDDAGLWLNESACLQHHYPNYRLKIAKLNVLNDHTFPI